MARFRSPVGPIRPVRVPPPRRPAGRPGGGAWIPSFAVAAADESEGIATPPTAAYRFLGGARLADSTDNGNDLAVASGTAAYADGPIRWRGLADTQAFDFNGSTQLSLADDASIRLGGRSMLVSLLFKLDSAEAAETNILAGKWLSTGTDDEREWLLLDSGSQNAVRFQVRSGSTAYGVNSTIHPVAGRWYHVIAWYDHDAAKVWISVNGETPVSGDVSGTPNSGTSPLRLGDTGSVGGELDGQLAEFALWMGTTLAESDRDFLWSEARLSVYPYSAISGPPLITGPGLVSAESYEGDEAPNARGSNHSLDSIVLGGTEYQVAGWTTSRVDASNYGAFALAVRSKPSGGSWSGWTTYIYDGVEATPELRQQDADDHNGASVGIDGDGLIHFAYGVHNDPLTYRRSDAAVSSWTGGLTAEQLFTNAGEGTNCSYPYFFRDPATGTLYVTWRTGVGSGDADQYLASWNGSAWSGVAGTGTDGLLIDYQDDVPDRNPYVDLMPSFSSDWDGAGTGTMCLTWTTRVTSDPNDQSDIHAAFWDGTSWTDADGNALTVPITVANKDPDLDIDVNSGLTSQNGSDLDSNGWPVIGYVKDDGSGYSNVFVSNYARVAAPTAAYRFLSGARLADSTGNGHTLSVAAGTAAYVAGPLDQAFDFNGSTRLAAADAAALRLGGRSMTVRAICRFDVIDGTEAIAGKWSSPGGDSEKEWFLHRSVGDSAYRFQVRVGSTAYGVNSTIDPTAASGTWNHVAAGYDHDAGEVWIQVDGETRVTASVTGTPNSGTTPLFLGDIETTTDMDGQLAEFAVWMGVSLSSADVALLRDGGSFSAYPFGYWTTTQVTSTTLDGWPNGMFGDSHPAGRYKIARPMVLVDRSTDVASLYTANEEDGFVLQRWDSDPGDFTTWTKADLLDSQSVGWTEPHVDYSAHRAGRGTRLLIAPSWRTPIDGTVTASRLYMVEE